MAENKTGTFIADGVLLPEPAYKLTYTEEDLQQSAYRDEATGKLHKKTVRWGTRRLDLKWPALTADEINTIRSATKGKESFTLQYYDTTDGINGTMTAYSGTLKYTLYSLGDGNAIYTDVSMPVIEI